MASASLIWNLHDSPLAYNRLSGYTQVDNQGVPNIRTPASVFKALSDETRLTMLGLLLEKGELCVCDFVAVMRITQSKASRHLRHLVNAGLLDDRREAIWVYFRIADQPGPVQAAVLEVLPSVLDGRMSEEIFERLENWNACKEQARGCCNELFESVTDDRGAK